MLTKDEIEKLLENVDPKLCAVFAARCSLRVLPLLVNGKGKNSFDYWEQQYYGRYLSAILSAQRHVFNVAIANNIAAIYVSTHRNPFFAAAADAADAASAFVPAVNISAAAAYASISYDDNDYAFYAAQTADAADAAVYGSIEFENRVLEEFKAAIMLDLSKVINFSDKTPINKSISDIFTSSPLWLENTPDDWQHLYQRWRQAVLDLDEGFEHWIEWYEERIKGVPLDPEVEKKWFEIPSEIREQGAKATNAYFVSLLSEKLSPLNLVRAIFIGDGAVGKTSLIRRLHGEPIVEGKEVMTPGIEIKQWALPGSEIKARFWDFGGQVMPIPCTNSSCGSGVCTFCWWMPGQSVKSANAPPPMTALNIGWNISKPSAMLPP